MTMQFDTPDAAEDVTLGGEAVATSAERGASLVEYALLMALIAVVCVAAVSALGGTTSEPFSNMQSGFAS